ncbi:hypothetical protein JCM8202v2_002249 [Rhodotorula sphaerocarpa]
MDAAKASTTSPPSPSKAGRGHGPMPELGPRSISDPRASEGIRPTGEWAPAAPAFEELPPSGLAHLPAAAVAPSVPAAASRKLKLQPSREQQQQQRPQKQVLTSSPNTIPLSPAQASLSYSLSRLLSLPRFAAFLHTPLGFAQFAAYLSGDPRSPSLAEFEFWKDTHVLAQLIAQAEAGMRGIASVYLAPDHPSGLELPEDMRQALYESLAEKWGGQSGLDRVSKHLLESLYRNEFEGFIKTRLVRHTQAQRAKYNLKPEDRGGIGSSFILTNPRLRDDPIVLVSPGFCELTGYSANQIIGRNCRFLQGKATDPKAVSNVREKLQKAQEVLQLVLNYRADGTPFMNLLHIMPLRDLDGNLSYFLAGQASITTALTTGTDLSLIIPEDGSPPADMTSFSPAVQLEARNPGQQWVLPPTEVLSAHRPSTTVAESAPPSPRRPSEALERVATAPQQGEEEEGRKSVHKLCFVPAELVRGFRRMFGLENRKARSPALQQEKSAGAGGGSPQVAAAPKHEPLVPPSQKDMRKMTLEQRLLDIQVTYDRIALIKRASREILFASASFLRTLGLPGTTRMEIDRSPLIYLDILELLVAPSAPTPTSNATKELRANVKQALADAVACNFECGFQCKKGGRAGNNPPLMKGRLFLAPLLNMHGEAVAVTAVMG